MRRDLKAKIREIKNQLASMSSGDENPLSAVGDTTPEQSDFLLKLEDVVLPCDNNLHDAIANDSMEEEENGTNKNNDDPAATSKKQTTSSSTSQASSPPTTAPAFSLKRKRTNKTEDKKEPPSPPTRRTRQRLQTTSQSQKKPSQQSSGRNSKVKSNDDDGKTKGKGQEWDFESRSVQSKLSDSMERIIVDLLATPVKLLAFCNHKGS